MSKGILKGKKGIVFLLILSMMATMFTMTSFASTERIQVEANKWVEFEVESTSIIRSIQNGDKLENVQPKLVFSPNEKRTEHLKDTRALTSSITDTQSSDFIAKLETNGTISGEYKGKVNASFKASLTNELNYSLKRESVKSDKSSYELTIENTKEYSFDPAKAAEGYNNLIVYTGVAYNTLDVKMRKYEITTRQEYVRKTKIGRWLSGYKKRTVEDRVFVGYENVEMKQPVLLQVEEYVRVGLAKSADDGCYLNGNTSIIGSAQ